MLEDGVVVITVFWSLIGLRETTRYPFCHPEQGTCFASALLRMIEVRTPAQGRRFNPIQEKFCSRYRESGLDNVWLVNGFHTRITSYGEAIAIEDVEGLYNAIARSLVEKAGMLGGKEIRFLRKHLGLSQRALGAVLGSNEETVSNWERGKSEIPPGADRLLRAYWRESKQGDARLKDLVERLAELDDPIDELEFRLRRASEREGHAQKGWRLVA